MPGCWARCRLGLRVKVMRRAIADSPEYADHMGHMLNKWCAIIMFTMYNIAAILIFTINYALYH
jgi:hypothetical protein